MELRVLNYFLAIAREQSIVHAAESLHLSQPTLSTQIKNLEEELGKQLLIRGTKGSRKVTLTEEGMILRKRAEEILDLVRRTESEIAMSDDIVIGDVYIGTGESNLCFRPLEPKLDNKMRIIWKKYQLFSKPAEKFLEVLRDSLEHAGGES